MKDTDAFPKRKTLSTERLNAVFRNATTSYKFYWFLAILTNVRLEHRKRIPIRELSLEMISNAWYPVNTFRLSFGAKDQFGKIVNELHKLLQCEGRPKKSEIVSLLKHHSHTRAIQSAIDEILHYVPYRFLTPWFQNELRGKRDFEKNNLIKEFSNRNPDSTLYSFPDDESINISDEWFEYLSSQDALLTGFTHWHLTQFLEKYNLNVPGIPSKLFPPQSRSSAQYKKFWSYFIESKGGRIKCIYSGREISQDKLSIDHYLPWNFVAHDQLWNLVPTLRQINSAKNDCLPSPIYMERFIDLQHEAFNKAYNGTFEKILLEDYVLLFKSDLASVAQKNKGEFRSIMIQSIEPLFQIAINMGFPTNWTAPGSH